MIPTWVTPRMVLYTVGTIVILGLGVGYCSAEAKAEKAAAQAALAAAAQHRADSLEAELKVKLAKIVEDSVKASVAIHIADSAKAKSDSLVRENRRLRSQIKITSDTTVRLAGDTIEYKIPAPVVAQLKQDAETIVALQETVTAKNSALVVMTAFAMAERDARIEAEKEIGALKETNTALKAQVKFLQPPKCGRTCGAVIGAGAVIAAVFLLK